MCKIKHFMFSWTFYFFLSNICRSGSNSQWSYKTKHLPTKTFGYPPSNVRYAGLCTTLSGEKTTTYKVWSNLPWLQRYLCMSIFDTLMPWFLNWKIFFDLFRSMAKICVTIRITCPGKSVRISFWTQVRNNRVMYYCLCTLWYFY